MSSPLLFILYFAFDVTETPISSCLRPKTRRAEATAKTLKDTQANRMKCLCQNEGQGL